ncbi:MAG: hypothetical protein A4E36_00477 [Methanoregulaceae archaeon PtaB.Bin009]|nr:MAG: hypothetical protein A4E36_00477 [Methanoregulaceae archaeon PtaB.Bin009]
MEIGRGMYMRAKRGMLTANPTMNLRNLSSRSRRLASSSASTVNWSASPRYWYPASSIAALMSWSVVREEL